MRTSICRSAMIRIAEDHAVWPSASRRITCDPATRPVNTRGVTPTGSRSMNTRAPRGVESICSEPTNRALVPSRGTGTAAAGTARLGGFGAGVGRAGFGAGVGRTGAGAGMDRTGSAGVGGRLVLTTGGSGTGGSRCASATTIDGSAAGGCSNKARAAGGGRANSDVITRFTMTRQSNAPNSEPNANDQRPPRLSEPMARTALATIAGLARRMSGGCGAGRAIARSIGAGCATAGSIDVGRSDPNSASASGTG